MVGKIKWLWVSILLFGVSAHSTDLADLRWDVFTRCNIRTAGTDQVGAATVDSILNDGIPIICTDFLAYIKRDTSVTSHGEWDYPLNSDYAELPPDRTPIVFCMRLRRQGIIDTTFYPIQPIAQADVFAVRAGSPPPSSTAEPSYVWVSGENASGVPRLIVWPIPRFADTLILGYQAVHPNLLHADSTLRISAMYHEHLVKWACWQVLWKVGRIAEGNMYMLWYENAKQAAMLKEVVE